MFLPPKDRTVLPPDDGWQGQAYYIVDVAYNVHNPVHRTIFYSGFLQNGEPAGYSKLWESNKPDIISNLHYLRAVKKIDMTEDT